MRAMILIAALVLAVAPAAADESFVQHTDTANGFVIAYPASWQVMPGNIAASKFKVATPDPQGMENCSVIILPNVVRADANPRNIVDDLVSTDIYEESLQPNYPGADVIEKGSTAVFGLPAFYTVTRFSFETLGGTLDLLTIDVVTWVKGTAYKAQCATEVDKFDQYRPLFQGILSSFMVTTPR